MVKLKQPSRRTFMKLAGATTLAAGASTTLLGAAPSEQQPEQFSANDKLQIATIGIGGQGTGDTMTALRVPGVELVAVADIYDGRLIRAKEIWGNQLFTTRDYREILARPEVDAVIIATPDHWHGPIAIEAMKAGKDVYVEKPMIQHVTEGQPVIDTAHQTKRILQVGSQGLSGLTAHKAKELLASGAIGALNMVEAWIDRNSAMGAWQYSLPPDASPQNIDWDRFLGRAPKRPFEPIRLFRWRNYQDYGTGVPGDLFVHLFSTIHYITNSLGPTRIMSTGGLRFWHDGRDVPDVMLGLYDYPKTAAHPAFNILLRVNLVAGGGETSNFRFIGDEGVMTLDAGVTLERKPRAKEPGFTIDTFPKAVQEQFLKQYRAEYPSQGPRLSEEKTETYTTARSYSAHLDHFKNFFAGVRSRQPVVEDAAFGLRAAGPAVLTNTSYFENRVVNWDPVKMKVV